MSEWARSPAEGGWHPPAHLPWHHCPPALAVLILAAGAITTGASVLVFLVLLFLLLLFLLLLFFQTHLQLECPEHNHMRSLRPVITWCREGLTHKLVQGIVRAPMLGTDVLDTLKITIW